MAGPTTKSLEERIDDIAEDMSSIKVQLGTHGTQIAHQGVQLATQSAQLTHQGSQLASQSELLASQSTQLAAINSQMAMTQSQIGALVGNMATLQAQLAGAVARLDVVTEDLRRTNARLDLVVQEMQASRREFTEFRGRVDAVINTTKWFGAFAATVFVSVVASGFYIARSAGSLDATVQQQQITLAEIKHDLGELRRK